MTTCFLSLAPVLLLACASPVFAALGGRLQGALTPPRRLPTSKLAACATNGRRQARRWRLRRKPPTPVISTRRWRPPRKPKRWQRLPFSKPQLKKKPGRRSKFVSVLEGRRHGHAPPEFSQARRRCGAFARVVADRAGCRDRPACTTSSASATRASCTSPIRMRSCCRFISASRASTSGSARWQVSRRISSDALFWSASASSRDSADAHAFTCLDFEKSALRFGKLGGFAHLKTLIDRLRSEAGKGRRCCSTAAICGKAADWPTPCRAPTWSRPPTCSASRP